MDRISEIKTLLGDELQRISRQMVTRARLHGSAPERNAGAPAIQERAALLGQLIAGLAIVDPALLDSAGAAYGSTVAVDDVDSGAQQEFTLMVGELVNVDAGQVSLASPIGQALLGARTGDVIAIATPQRVMRLRVIAVRSIEQLVRNDGAGVYRESARILTA